MTFCNGRIDRSGESDEMEDADDSTESASRFDA
jgi:hypothetical protein